MNAADLLGYVSDAGAAVWRASWQASVLAALVCVVQLTFGRRIPPRWRHTMWLLVLVRLALPVVPSSPLSVFNFAPTTLAPGVSEVEKPSNIRANVGTFTGTADRLVVEAEVTVMPPPDAPPVLPPAVDLWTGWPQVLAACWLAGVALLALRVTWATWRVSRMMRRLERVEDPTVQQVLRDAAAELRVRRLPLLHTGDGFFNPALVGFIRPRLLLPADLLRGFNAAELRLVLLHELAHLKRRDVAVNWFATLLTVLHWPNPLAWIVAWRLRVERELACDELVMSRTIADADRRAYGHTIVKLLETFSRAARAPARPMPGAVGILEDKQQMKRRITMIAQFAGTRARGWTVVAAALVLGLGAVALTDAMSAEPSDKEKTPTTSAAKPAAPETVQTPDGEEYVIGSGDLLQVSISGLEGVGLTTVKQTRVSGTGNVALPYLKEPVKVAGFTARDAQKEIAKAYQKGGVLENANLSIDVMEARHLKGTIGDRELVTVSIMDLVGQGVETVKTSRVDDDGSINLPYIASVKAKGVRPAELEKAIAQAYKDKGLLKSALVVVSLPGRGESHTLSERKAAPPQIPGHEMDTGGRQGRNDGDPFGGVPAEIDPAIQAQLDRKLPEVVFEGVGLSDVIDFLRDVTSANIFVDWRALEEAGIDRNAPVNTRLKDVAFKNALAIVLRGVGEGLYYEVENQVIQIGVRAPKKNEKLEVKTYDAGEVLGDAAGPEIKARMAELRSVVCENVSPATWHEQGGPGKVNALGTRLVVTAPESVHQEVAALLKTLRDNPATKPTAVKKAELQKAAQALWEKTYRLKVIDVGGRSNLDQVKAEFEEEVKRIYPDVDVKALKLELN